ncbi:MAG: hypothetical protein JZU50_13360, partial [Desulfobulbaceae bacterium]|nr:hypothetical protein [Desulfobulbaceae bacterium]
MQSKRSTPSYLYQPHGATALFMRCRSTLLSDFSFPAFYRFVGTLLFPERTIRISPGSKRQSKGLSAYRFPLP